MNDRHSCDEINLIRLTANGSESAFEMLYAIYYKRLFRFIYRLTGRLDLVDALINDVMFVVWEKASSFNGACKLSTWIFGIAYNKARDSRGYSEKELSHDVLEEDNQKHMQHSRDWVSRLEEQDWLSHAFEVLSMEQRLVIELTYYQGMSYPEIARMMECSENTVKTRMFYARKKLAKKLLEGNSKKNKVNPGDI